MDQSEMQGTLAPAEMERASKPMVSCRATDLIAFLDAHQSYIEIGPSFKPNSAFVCREGDGWKCQVFNGARYVPLDEDELLYATAYMALAALRDRWMQ